MKHYLRIFIITAVIALTGCSAKPANYAAMSVKGDSASAQKAMTSKFHNKMTVASVSGGKDTHPLLISTLDNKNLKLALNDSLAYTGYITTPEEAQYKLDAEVLKLQYPKFIGINFITTSSIQYKITDLKTNEIIFSETVEAVKGAEISDSFFAGTRLRIAIEASVRKNIASFMQRLESENG